MSLFTATTVDEVKRLIELGHDINSIDRSHFSVLHCACEKGKLDIVKVLCEAGVNFNNKNGEYYPIDKAVEAGYLDIVKYLIENYPVKLDNVLYKASSKGNIDVLDYLLTLNLELNNSCNNPLQAACRHGYIDAVDRLLYAGADTNITNKSPSIIMAINSRLNIAFGSPAIVIATLYNKLDFVKKLVMFGADYHTYGGYLLVMSCKYRYDDISEFLIDLGCNPNYCIDYMTPLMHACSNKNLKIVKLLLERGADPNFINDIGLNAFHYCTIQCGLGTNYSQSTFQNNFLECDLGTNYSQSTCYKIKNLLRTNMLPSTFQNNY